MLLLGAPDVFTILYKMSHREGRSRTLTVEKSVPKSVIHLLSCCFANFIITPFLLFRCFRRWGSKCLHSLFQSLVTVDCTELTPAKKNTPVMAEEFSSLLALCYWAPLYQGILKSFFISYVESAKPPVKDGISAAY